MKKLFLTLFLTVITTAMLQAQQISVVSSGGTTKLYNTLADAINGADPGSVIYLPGGGFPISDDVKITKKLTIIGIGHYVKSGNVDGITTISGNFFFNEGSSGSAIMGCYITGNVIIGDGDASVNDALIKYCNLNNVEVKNNTCLNIIVNQNYVRGSVYNVNGLITNNIIGNSIRGVMGGTISYNIIQSGSYGIGANDSFISNNILFADGHGGYGWQHYIIEGYNNIVSNNMCRYNCGDDCINIGEINWTDVFVNYLGTTPASNFHFKDEYKQYENQVGIYAGDGFNDNQLAPVPYIVAKHVDQQTDAQGKLNIKIRVKAGQ